MASNETMHAGVVMGARVDAMLKGASLTEIMAALEACEVAANEAEFVGELQLDRVCPGCLSIVESLTELEKLSENTSTYEVIAERRVVVQYPGLMTADHLAWITPCCGAKVTLSPAFTMTEMRLK